MIKFKHDRLNEEGEYQPRNVCSVAAAILGGSAISGISSYLGSSSASSAQVAAQQQAMALQREMFGKAENALSPFINMGKEGIGKLTDWFNPTAGSGSPLEALMKLVMPGSNMSDTLAETPGYQFAEDRGLKAVNNALAKRGLAGSGGAVSKGAGDFVTGLASGTWQNVVQALQGALTSGGNALSGIVNTGAQSGSALAGNAIGTGTGLANSATGIGNAQAGGIMGGANAIGNFGNSLGSAALINQMTGGSNPMNWLSSLISGGVSNPGVAGGGYLGSGGTVYAGPGAYNG